MCPVWYTAEDASAWNKIKAAFRRDWQQTKHDFGSSIPALKQRLSDTVAQAIGSEPIPPGNVPTEHQDEEVEDECMDSDEQAYRYGYAARRHWGEDWNDETESAMRKEWGEDDWSANREAVRRGWEFGQMQSMLKRSH